MKSLVVYSSRTGNTEKVARAIYAALPQPADIHCVDDCPDPSKYDFVALGFWVDRGAPDAKAQEYMRSVQGKAIGLFGTLGAWPDSEHAKDCVRKAEELVQGNQVLGSFLCQGRIDPRIIEAMQKAVANTHPMTPERKARIQEAEKHPDEQDLQAAQDAFRGMLEAFVPESLCVS
ncbi:MAG: flavodoxin family protein [Desulfomicrobium sp.]|nr:flavodoxin family protein [Desulfomicrobium sp.]